MYERDDAEPAPGTRLGTGDFDITICCLDEADLAVSCTSPEVHSVVRFASFQVLRPASAGSALLSSPVELDTDSIGVVTGQPNDDGTHTVIFKKQGSQARQVDIDSDVGLLPADVLRDLIDLGQDPDTGEHVYLADIEW